uniref:Response regulator transcription factor n=1 Tax=Fundidesulfovibrio putealis TaxID=270496 RepID=A0A7C4AAW8_9BACT
MHSGTVRVVLVEDIAVIRKALRMMLGANPRIEVVGEAGDGAQALERTAALRPDVLLLDLSLPGNASIADILALNPGTAVVVYTASTDPGKLGAAIAAGARGCLTKSASGPELAAAILRVGGGAPFVHTIVADLIRREPKEGERAALAGLDARQREMLAMHTGLSDAELAARLGVSPEGLAGELAALMERLDLPDRAHLLLYGVELGLSGGGGNTA